MTADPTAKSKAPPSTSIYDPSLTVPMTEGRPLKVFAYDPSRGRRPGNIMTVTVRYEPLAQGPIGDRFAVVDYDGFRHVYYAPVNLDDPAILMRGGLDPTEDDPRFHQQMVYAVASETLERFERALGRRVHWRRPIDGRGRPVHGRKNRLLLHPHAMQEANAFYSPGLHGILFGYFRASMTDPGQNLPGQTVFTCLSRDIIAHETTHAIVDSIRAYFMEPTNIDVAAFHEAFADLAALFSHFSHREMLIDTLEKTGGRLYALRLKSASSEFGDGGEAAPVQIQADIAEQNPLIGLANQFGQASGMQGALRSAIGSPPNSRDIETVTEPHARGSILVAAVFDAFFTVYLARATPLLRVYRAGGRTGDTMPTGLAELLATEASKTADTFFTLCARALDYCPPVDITFGDFLRALITADFDFYPNDTDGIREALMQAFRLRGITAEDARYLSEDSLRWPELARDRLPTPRLIFGDPNGLTREEQDVNGGSLRTWAKENAATLGFDPAAPIEIPSFHPTVRVAQDGTLKLEMVVEMIQTRWDETASVGGRPVPIRGGLTLIIAKPGIHEGMRDQGHVRFAIAKRLTPAREQRVRTTLASSEIATQSADGRLTINFGLVHGGA